MREGESNPDNLACPGKPRFNNLSMLPRHETNRSARARKEEVSNTLIQQVWFLLLCLCAYLFFIS